MQRGLAAHLVRLAGLGLLDGDPAAFPCLARGTLFGNAEENGAQGYERADHHALDHLPRVSADMKEEGDP